MPASRAADRINFDPPTGPNFFSAGPLEKMAMSQSERIRHIQEQANSVISRNRCVDSSLLTLQRQAQASKMAAPITLEKKVIEDGCCRTMAVRGKGTNMDYTAILQRAQACAICPDVPVADTGVSPVIILPTPCINNTVIPFAQQNISTIYPPPYVPPCTDPGNRQYFPVKPVRGDGPNCKYQHLPYDTLH